MNAATFSVDRRIFTAVAFLTLGLAACTPMKKLDQQLVAEPDPVSLRLAQAVDKASSALQTLASVEQARTPSAGLQTVPNATQEMRRTVTMDWTGPIEPAIRTLAERAGYQFQVNGNAPPMPIIVSLHSTERSVVEVLRDAGLQAGRRADVAIDPDRRVVELNYASVSDE